ncbi:hypothetical protein OBBRIDRAFT_755737 [Obba rivulosa]|uniref:Protein CPL1-like domain-containing protein n=1 Tax=Obba rivulosa TaxID=1052685 RepID=A0A8E2AXE8_9APHY|nr:hypothetical protein OBBRIDRAFT_755737 [Obba rivulosa]
MRMLAAFALALTLVRPAESSSLTARSSSDTCANVNSDLKVSSNGHTVDVGHINQCLCLSTVPSFILTNSVAQAAVALVGQSATQTAIDNLITSSSSKKTCSYPDNASPACSSSNPCSFTCSNGYTPWPPSNPSSCACVFPKKECNGVCGNFNTCTSPQARKRAVPVSMRARASCATGLTPCGVPSSAWARSPAWECVDTESDLESCGGCAIPLGGGTSMGIDCAALPGVADVSCIAGACVVHRCMPGYQRARDGNFCLRSRNIAQLNDQGADAFGLEHVPLHA